MNYISNQNISLSGTSDDYMRSFRPSKLCSDLAFWKHRYLNDSQEALQYVEAKRCSTYETRSIRNETCLPNQIYCSNKDTCLTNINECEGHFYFGNETQCKNLNMYHCPESNQCIWQDWVCDGFVQCLEGDDEDFDVCYNRGSFAEGATVKCNETKRYTYNITILATKCNHIIECENEEDEKDCQTDELKVSIVLGVFFAVILLIWIWIHHFYGSGQIEENISKQKREWAQNLKGDSLAFTKVLNLDIFLNAFQLGILLFNLEQRGP